MRRISIWLIATLAVVAMISYYQVSLSGDGKAAEGTSSGTSSDHTGKPGETK